MIRPSAGLANVAAATASLTAGAAVVVTSVLVDTIEPATLASIRYLIALLCLAPVLPYFWPKIRITALDIGKIAALGVIFFCAFPWAFTAALVHTTPARGAIGLATMPIQTLIVAVLLGREHFTRYKVLSVILAFVGVAVVFGPEAMNGSDSNYLKGDLLMLFGVFNSSLYIVLSRSMIDKFNAMFVMTIAMLFGALFLAILAWASGELTELPVIGFRDWQALLFLGVIAGAIQFFLFVWALGLLPPTRAAIYLVLSPVSAILLSVLVLDETMTTSLIVGLVLIVFGIYLNSRRPKTS